MLRTRRVNLIPSRCRRERRMRGGRVCSTNSLCTSDVMSVSRARVNKSYIWCDTKCECPCRPGAWSGRYLSLFGRPSPHCCSRSAAGYSQAMGPSPLPRGLAVFFLLFLEVSSAACFTVKPWVLALIPVGLLCCVFSFLRSCFLSVTMAQPQLAIDDGAYPRAARQPASGQLRDYPCPVGFLVLPVPVSDLPYCARCCLLPHVALLYIRLDEARVHSANLEAELLRERQRSGLLGRPRAVPPSPYRRKPLYGPCPRSSFV
jgi:hypothetical protein